MYVVSIRDHDVIKALISYKVKIYINPTSSCLIPMIVNVLPSRRPSKKFPPKFGQTGEREEMVEKRENGERCSP